MKTLFKITAILSLLAISSLVISQFSDNLAPRDESGLSTQAAGECNGIFCVKVDVNRIYVNTNGLLYVTTSGDETGLSCNLVAPNKYLFVKDDVKNYKEVYTTLLGAKFNNEKVTMQMTGAGTDCRILTVYIGDL